MSDSDEATFPTTPPPACAQTAATAVSSGGNSVPASSAALDDARTDSLNAAVNELRALVETLKRAESSRGQSESPSPVALSDGRATDTLGPNQASQVVAIARAANEQAPSVTNAAIAEAPQARTANNETLLSLALKFEEQSSLRQERFLSFVKVLFTLLAGAGIVFAWVTHDRMSDFAAGAIADMNERVDNAQKKKMDEMTEVRSRVESDWAKLAAKLERDWGQRQSELSTELAHELDLQGLRGEIDSARKEVALALFVSKVNSEIPTRYADIPWTSVYRAFDDRARPDFDSLVDALAEVTLQYEIYTSECEPMFRAAERHMHSTWTALSARAHEGIISIVANLEYCRPDANDLLLGRVFDETEHKACRVHAAKTFRYSSADFFDAKIRARFLELVDENVDVGYEVAANLDPSSAAEMLMQRGNDVDADVLLRLVGGERPVDRLKILTWLAQNGKLEYVKGASPGSKRSNRSYLDPSNVDQRELVHLTTGTQRGSISMEMTQLANALYRYTETRARYATVSTRELLVLDVPLSQAYFAWFERMKARRQVSPSAAFVLTSRHVGVHLRPSVATVKTLDGESVASGLIEDIALIAVVDVAPVDEQCSIDVEIAWMAGNDLKTARATVLAGSIAPDSLRLVQ